MEKVFGGQAKCFAGARERKEVIQRPYGHDGTEPRKNDFDINAIGEFQKHRFSNPEG